MVGISRRTEGGWGVRLGVIVSFNYDNTVERPQIVSGLQHLFLAVGLGLSCDAADLG